ncbi:hypothetical protein BJF78_24730 [Pseudonocardia sp. CNS-139]|nr:hypothetical protein BJF78_24730 [Pseudonocardia sp. CNS-139]
MLVHFCGRPPGTSTNPELAPAIAQMSPEERLTNILWEQAIWGTAAFRSGPNAVSFSEVSGAHLHWLIYSRGFPPWGLIFDRQTIYNAGGGPVWYARREQAAAASQAGLSEWVVPFDTTWGARSDWVHEQEWRLPREGWRPPRPAASSESWSDEPTGSRGVSSMCRPVGCSSQTDH